MLILAATESRLWVASFDDNDLLQNRRDAELVDCAIVGPIEPPGG